MTTCNTHVGPVSFVLGQPNWSVAAAPVTGVRPANFGGYAPLPAAYQLNELVNNSDAVQTMGPATGVLAYVYDEQDVLAQLRGWWLLSTGDVRTGLVEMTMVHDRGTNAGWVQVTLTGVMLGSNREVVVTRSARPRTNIYGLVPVGVIADPFWDQAIAGEPFVPVPYGAVGLNREYDPTSPHSTPANGSARFMTLYTGPMVGGVDLLPPTVVPSPRSNNIDPPSWVTNRGGDVRAYDRHSMSEVYGRDHWFGAVTDILVTNGLLRFWTGNRGIPPYLNMQAFTGGAWRSIGCVLLSASGAEPLRGVRLVRLTSEMATIVLTSRSQGDVSVTLRRGARSLDVHHGSERPPFTITTRSVGWAGMPPTRTLTGASSGTGRFGKGLMLSGVAQWQWPPDQSKYSWGFAGWWLPTSASTSQPDSGLLGLTSSAGLVGGVTWTTSDKKLHFSLGASTIDSPALTFDAAGAVFWAVALDPAVGMTLVVATAPPVTSTTTAVAVDPGTADATYDSFAVGAMGAPYGSTPFGSGIYGGILVTRSPNGVVDNLMLFDGALTATEMSVLATGTTGLACLPHPEGRLIWYAPFDTVPAPLGSALATGRRFEATVANGSTRSPDEFGLTKGLAALDTVAPVGLFGISRLAPQADFAAFLATTATYDDIADHHAQFAAISEQEVRLR